MKKFMAVVVLLILAGIAVYYLNQRGMLAGGNLTVPIQLNSAEKVGGVLLDLVYDPDVLEAVEVKAGELARNALIETDLTNPGHVQVGVIELEGMSGDGTLVDVVFKSKSGDQESSLIFERVEVRHAETLYELVPETSAGAIAANTRSVTPPVITF
jgi:hypothetical protein